MTLTERMTLIEERGRTVGARLTAAEANCADLADRLAVAEASVAEQARRLDILRSLVPTPTGKYGAPVSMDGLANMQIGGPASGAPNVTAALRFRAEHADQITAVRTYWLGPEVNGYGGGTGGRIRMTVEADADGLPDGVPLGAAEFDPASGFPIVPVAAVVAAGGLYHLVFTNVDPQPVVNFASLNFGFLRYPIDPPGDLAAFRRLDGGAWKPEPKYLPIVDITYADGAHQGQGYMEVEGPNEAVIGGLNVAREVFTVSGGSRVVTGASVRVARTSGTGDLQVRIEDSNGVPITAGRVNIDHVPVLAPDGATTGVWVDVALPAVALLHGSDYRLAFTSDTAVLWSRGIQKGSAYGFHPATYFADGFLEVSADGGGSWATVQGLGTAGDLQFYLR